MPLDSETVSLAAIIKERIRSNPNMRFPAARKELNRLSNLIDGVEGRYSCPVPLLVPRREEERTQTQRRFTEVLVDAVVHACE